jgi:hypothetical protein
MLISSPQTVNRDVRKVKEKFMISKTIFTFSITIKKLSNTLTKPTFVSNYLRTFRRLSFIKRNSLKIMHKMLP